MGSEVTNDKKKKVEITDVISKWIPLLTGIIPLIVAAINVILIFLNYDYARKAEDFYEIPGRYFTNSFVDDKVMIFVSMVAYFVILCLPSILKKLYRVRKLGKFEGVCFSFVVAILIFPIVFCFIIKILGILNIRAKEIVGLFVTGIIAVLTFVMYLYLFWTDFAEVRKEDLKKQENSIKEEKKEENGKKKNKKKIATTKEAVESDNQEKAGDTGGGNKSTEERIATNIEDKKKVSEKIKGLKKELSAKFEGFKKEFPALFFAAVLIIVSIAPFIITADRIIENPKNKTKYELVTINDGDKGNKRDMAVVSYKNGKAVLMEFTVTPAAISGGETEILLLTKGKYRLIDIEGYQVEYKEFNAVKCE